jgi:hypothetical protein
MFSLNTTPNAQCPSNEPSNLTTPASKTAPFDVNLTQIANFSPSVGDSALDALSYHQALMELVGGLIRT